jgi:hypothetical protein
MMLRRCFVRGPRFPVSVSCSQCRAWSRAGSFGPAAKLYGEIGPAFYGLRTTLLTLLFMALLRIKRPEHLKERDPAAFGRLLGLDRAPEVKTLRRRLTRLAAHHCAEQLGAELARLRVDQRGHLMGFLYVDGHVRAYHGDRPIASKAYVARRHLAMPASIDYWINDRSGDPLLVITGEVNAALTRALPRIVREVRELVGERGGHHRLRPRRLEPEAVRRDHQGRLRLDYLSRRPLSSHQ